MFAIRRSMAIHEFLMIGLAATVIAMSFWPLGSERQWFDVRTVDQNTKTLSVAVDSPELSKLHRKLARWQRGTMSKSLAVAKWTRESAEHYEQQLLQKIDLVEHQAAILPVSFQDNGFLQQNEATLKELRRHANHWNEVKQRAGELAERGEAKRRQLPAPIVFREVTPARHTSATLLKAGGVGILTALAFAFWSLLAPTIRLSDEASVDADSSNRSQGESGIVEFGLRVPISWIRVRQSIMARLRQVTVLALVLFALTRIIAGS